MPELLRTSKTKGHDHIAYLRDNGTGSTSKDKEHFHEIRLEAEVPAVVDQDLTSPLYGQTVREAVPGGWRIQPGEDGHTHEPGSEIQGKDPEEEKDEEKIVQETIELWRAWREAEKDSREKGRQAEEYYKGNQWDEEKKKKLEKEDRAALTIDKCSEKIDNLSGYQRQNRTDLKFMPTEEGDQAVADILNIVHKNCAEQCDWAREETKVFNDEQIVGRGNINLFIDYDRDIMGRIVMEHYPWDEVTYGPHNKEDLSDCEGLIKEKWYSQRRLQQMYPEKAGKFTPEAKENDSAPSEKSEDWDKTHKKSEWAAADLVNLAKKEFRLLDLWLKEYRRAHVLVFAEDEFVFNAEGWSEADVKAVKTISGFSVIPRVTYKIRERKVISGILLEDDYPDLAIEDFHMIPVYASRRGNDWWGKIEKVKDLQNMINKCYSQFVDILNRMAAYGWFYDNETFPNKQAAEKFRKIASKPGFTQEVSSVERPPQKVEGTKFPAELVQAIAMFNTDMREIMNINLEMLQGGQQYESGVAIRQKIVQQLLGNDFLFDNLSFAKKKMGRIFVAMVQKIYTPERILRIIANQNAKETIEIGGKKLEEWKQDDIMKLLRDADLSKYDVVVTEAPSSPSAMIGNFLLLLEMASKGVQIPPSAFFRFAPLPGKEKILEELEAAAAAQKEAEDKKYQTEIDKAKIAQTGKMAASNAGQGTGEGKLLDRQGMM